MTNRPSVFQAILILAGIVYAAGCSGPSQKGYPEAGQMVSPQRVTAIQESRVPSNQQKAEQEVTAAMEARARASLKPGTRIYYIPMITIADRGTVRQFPGDSAVSRMADAIIVTPPNGKAVTFGPGAQIIYVPRGGEAFVAPGRPVPLFLRNRVPNEITH